jgi:hypothetical protein
MSENSQYRWSTKLKKFNVTDPFLRFIAEKYENEITWQSVVRDEDTFKEYVEKVMLPKLLEKVDLSKKTAKKNFYITENHISLDASLNGEENANDKDIQAIKILRAKEGDSAALIALVKLINKRKQTVFKKWIRILDKNYPQQFAFKLLLLRPLFELAGHGTRRTVIEPSINTISWIYLRIQKGRLLPNENVAFQYCLKQGMGGQKKIINGWQFIPSGIKNASKLSAISNGSGWCIAGNYYATEYLSDCDFYILRANNKPLVALRISKATQCVLECRGRYNYDPEGWWVDIWLFLEILNIDNAFRKKIKLQANLETEDWWKERVKLFVFSAVLAPDSIKNKLILEIQSAIFQYADFNNFHELAENLGIVTDQYFWSILIESNPQKYDICPFEFKEFEIIKQACIDGWFSYIQDDQLALNEIGYIPEFVKNDNLFSQALNDYFPSTIKKAIRKQPTTWSERADRFLLEDVIPESSIESAQVACERMVNILLNNENGIFADEIFSEIIRQRQDFQIIRERAWIEAIKTHPPLWFALPFDLKDKQIFQLDNQISKVDIDTWREKVHFTPWLLTNKTGVPKSIRFHISIMNAYREGWLSYLQQHPWRIWVSHGGYYNRRSYMSYALLADEIVIDTLTKAWAEFGDKLLWIWKNQPSHRMKSVPAIQLSVLRAISSKNFFSLAEESIAIAILIRRDIEKIFFESKIISPFDKEIESKILQSRRLYG